MAEKRKQFNRSTRMKVICYGRFSTADQDPRSIPDQMRVCRECLTTEGVVNAEVTEKFDNGISGELLSRPGIDEVRRLVQTGDYDLVVGEDVSRFFRDRNEPGRFAGMCLDHGTRFIAVADGVDTNLSNWKDVLHQVVARYASDNEDTARRIIRSSRGRWEAGYAMGPLVPGYRRIPVDLARYEAKRRGPFKDEKNAAWSDVIAQMFERVSRGDPLWSVAEFLNRQGLPNRHNAKGRAWNFRGVRALIRNPVYKGVERFGTTHSVKHYGSGRHRQERKNSEEVMYRDMPHLAFVDATLWEMANGAISDRDLAGHHPQGRANPQYQIPRDRRGPLNGHFHCGVCGGRMVGQGRPGGGFRCGNALKGLCWNLASVPRDLAAGRIFGAVVDRLLLLDGAADAFVDLVDWLLREDGDVEKQAVQMRGNLDRLAREIDAYAEAVGKGQDLDILLVKLRDRRDKRDRIEAELAALERQVGTRVNPPSREQILVWAREAAQLLPAMDNEAGIVLQQITTPIQATPYQRIDCGLVVLRARFQVDLRGLLPSQWRQLLRRAEADLSQRGIITEEVTIDLFESPSQVRLAREALTLHGNGHTGKAIAEKLGVNRRMVYDAIRIGELMAKHKLDEPYVRLTERPSGASRWRQGRKGDASAAS